MKPSPLSTIVISVIIVRAVDSRCRQHPCWEQAISHLDHPQSKCPNSSICLCSENTTDCSSKQLSFIPKVGKEYQNLNFSNNNVKHISNDSFFTNVSWQVKVIDLYNNGLAYIAPTAFQNLSNLVKLVLGGSNHFDFKSMPSLLSIPHVQHVSMGCLGLGLMPEDTFLGVNETDVTELDFSWNEIPSLDMSVLQPLHNVCYFNVWENEIYDLKTTYMPFLTILILGTNRLFEFPSTCSPSGESLFPNLTFLDLSQNMIECIDQDVCLPSLKKLDLNYNHFQQFSKNAFSSVVFPGLKQLRIMQMENKIERVDPFFLNNSALEMVVFMFNLVDFSSDTVSEDAFGGCTRIEVLRLRGNNFQKMTDEKFHRLFKPFEHSLTELYLSNAHIDTITPNTFSRLRKLETLILFQNFLSAIPDGAFNNLPALSILYLDGNNIATISENTFDSQLRSRLTALTLGDNPFHCSCDILWFKRWIEARPQIFTTPHMTTYNCANFQHVTLSQFVLNNQACMLGSDAASFTIALSCVVIVLLLLFTIFFRFRWHVRLWLYEMCRGRRRRTRRRRFRYDVFVSYAEEDMGWVEDELLPVLEGQWGLRACVHQRDFLPGKHIVDNITDCVDDSDRMLVVLSPHFARSEWCQFELRFCQVSAMDRDDVMVLVTLKETRSRDMRGALLAILRTTTYIEWGEERDARASFWGRLRLALEESCEVVMV